jgi:hypothetical protein
VYSTPAQTQVCVSTQAAIQPYKKSAKRESLSTDAVSKITVYVGGGGREEVLQEGAGKCTSASDQSEGQKGYAPEARANTGACVCWGREGYLQDAGAGQCHW